MRCGVVAVVGRPNVGKSTLVNALVGAKVSIVSDKPQTTRRGIRGIRTTESAQVVFVDTPGFHKPRTALGSRLNEMVAESTEGVDAIVQVVDAAAGVGRGDTFVYVQQLAPHRVPRFCAVNKVDAIRRRSEVPQLQAASDIGPFDEIVPLSATTGAGVGLLLDLVVERLPEGEPLYPPDEVTDVPLEERLAELVREQALAVTRAEVPHSIAVIVEHVEERGSGGSRSERERASGSPQERGSGGSRSERERASGSPQEQGSGGSRSERERASGSPQEQGSGGSRSERERASGSPQEQREQEHDLTRVHADLIVERDSQKGIVIGRGGQTLKAIGSRARAEMERLLGTKVFLDLRVRVVKEWQRDPKALQRLGFG